MGYYNPSKPKNNRNRERKRNSGQRHRNYSYENHGSRLFDFKKEGVYKCQESYQKLGQNQKRYPITHNNQNAKSTEQRRNIFKNAQEKY